MLDANKIVHGLWIGKTLSKLELLTIRSFITCGHTLWLWVYDVIETTLPEEVILKDANTIIPQQQVFQYQAGNEFGHGKGSFAGFSDIFRYKLLYEYGGWWTDMDVTCLRPLDFDAAYVFRQHDVLPAVGNIMKCPKGSLLMQRCYERACIEVTASNTDWLKPIRILNEGISHFGLSTYIKNISNVDRWEVVAFYHTFPMKLDANFYVFHWMNEEWRAKGLDKNSCIKNSFLDRLMTQHQVEIARNKPPNAFIYYYKRAKMTVVPLLPRPLRVFIKNGWWYTAAVGRWLGAKILPIFPRSWKDYVKRAMLG